MAVRSLFAKRPGWSQRIVLRTGFGAALLLLLVSGIESYRILTSSATRSVEIFRNHSRLQDQVYTVRRNLYLAGIAARDYLLDPGQAQLARFSEELSRLVAETMNAAASVGSLRPEVLDAELRQYFQVLRSVPDRVGVLSPAQRYAFVQNEIVPRRNALGAILRDLEAANRDALVSGELQFAANLEGGITRLALMLGLCLLVGAVAIGFSLRYSDRLELKSARAYADAVAAKEGLQQLSTRLLDVQEEERRRLSHELHDEIGQLLTALRIEISRALPATVSESERATRLQRAREMAEQTLGTVRNISLLLRPALLDDLGLAAAVQWHCEDFSRRAGIPCSFEEDGGFESLPDTVKTCLYRIVQEGLNNCQKHAHASRVAVSLRRIEDGIVLRVEDNGVGFFGRTSSGLGILGMKERAAALGGTLTVERGPAGGTRVDARFPLPEPARRDARVEVA